LGSVVKFNRWTLDVDAYYSHFQNPYSSYLDLAGESFFYQTGPSNTKGVEAESNILLGAGFSLYLNGTMGCAKYQGGANYANGGLWIANSPKNTEAVGLTYIKRNWDVGFFNKRVGPMYNDNGTLNQAVNINPFNVTNLFFNYTIRGDSALRGTKLRFGINNLLNQHSIVGIAPASTKSNAPAPGDILTLLPARSLSVTMTFGYAPRL
jgi:iron complex outermembrane receptor protein